MSEKIGLCVVYKNHNYGSILQSYATLLKLKDLDRDYEIICYNPRKDLLFYIKSLPRLFNSDMFYSKMRSFRRKLGKKLNKEYARNDSVRASVFDRFINERFLHFSKNITSYEALREYSEEYTNIMVGSDQLWLPSGLGSNFYNLWFAPDKVNKIAYAASFGVGEIPFYQKKRTQAYLDRINHISVREHSGKELIKKLTGRDVPVIVDPTLVIDKELWDKSIPNEAVIEEDYIFCYFLGNNPDQREEAKKLSSETGLKIVTLRHMDEYIDSDETFGDIAPYDVGPAEFVNLIRNASYVCTDSFHGSVFSIINHKQFISFNRYGSNSKNSRNSRLDSLFSQLGIERRFNGDIVKDIMAPIDYEKVDQKLERLRAFAEDYLIKALE